MLAKLAFVCFSCDQIFERAPGGVCAACSSERIVSVQSLMHEHREPPPIPRAAIIAHEPPTVFEAWFEKYRSREL